MPERPGVFLLMGAALLVCSSCKDHGDPVNVDGKLPCPPFAPEPAFCVYQEPIWHPTGSFIGFNYFPIRRISYPYGEQCEGQYEFVRDSGGYWLINPDGTNLRRILPYWLHSVAWSPDGEWIAFGSDHILKMRFTGAGFDTTTLTDLTPWWADLYGPTWSPDGQRIAFSYSNCSGGVNCGVWLMTAQGTGYRHIALYGMFPQWSPLSNREVIYLTRAVIGFGQVLGDSLWSIDTETSEKHLIRFLSEINYESRSPKYSPDGSHILFWSMPSRGGLGNLWLMNPDGTNARQLTTEGAHDYSFDWSPDGSCVIYAKYKHDDWSYRNGTLWVINAESGAERQLTFNPHLR